jgi:hypothetical protein
MSLSFCSFSSVSVFLGMMKSAVIDHNHELFTKIELLPTKILSEHEMKSYRSSMNAAKHALSFAQSRKKHSMIAHIAGNNDEKREERPVTFEESYSSLFPMDVMKTRGNELPYLIRNEHIPQMQQPLTKKKSVSEFGSVHSVASPAVAERKKTSQNINGDSVVPSAAEDEGEFSDPKEAQESLIKKLSKRFYFTGQKRKKDDINDSSIAVRSELASLSAAVLSAPFEETNEGKDEGHGEEGDDDDNTSWLPCSVCSLEVTWPYMMHSDASRSIATHNCSSCGKIVCTVCSPAGDEIPGDGISQRYKVPDFRIALPWLGLYAPQRVCLHCYYDSTYPGLSSEMI